MEFDFDLYVIGGGSGGVRAARIAAGEHGAKVGIAEASRMGGTCVIRGCVPKKLMIFASGAPDAAAESRGYGWPDADAGRFDWPQFRTSLHAELSRLEGLYRKGLEGAGVTIHDQHARIIDPHQIELADGQRFSARHILIAVGGRPQRMDIPGAELAMISDDLFTLETLPERVLVIGGGFIACEFATILNGLGSKVTQVHRGDAVLRGFDIDMRRAVSNQLAEIGIDLQLETNVTALARKDGAITASLDNGTEAAFDAVIMATGRVPNTEGLGLDAVGIEPGLRGEIPVDAWSQTGVPSIYAVGDVTDRINLTPVAIREGHSFVDTVFGGKPRKMDHSLVAQTVFTRPHELATIGLTEEAAATHGPITIYEAAFRPMRSLFAGSEARMQIKLIVASDSDKVLGCHIFGPEAGEMIQLVAIAIGMGATKADFDAAVAVHPTLAEEIVTMRQPSRHVGQGA